jgi:hypothetical protein
MDVRKFIEYCSATHDGGCMQRMMDEQRGRKAPADVVIELQRMIDEKANVNEVWEVSWS